MVDLTLCDNASKLFWLIFDYMTEVDVTLHDSCLTRLNNFNTYLSIFKSVIQLFEEGHLTPLEAEVLINNVYMRINHMFYVYAAIDENQNKN